MTASRHPLILKRLLVCLGNLELDDGEVILTLWVLLMEMLGGAILLILESDDIFVTPPTGDLFIIQYSSLVKDPCMSLEIVSGLGRW